MKRIMFLFVGGLAEPIAKAIKPSHPDYIYFFCSRDPRGSEHKIADPGDTSGHKRTITCHKCHT